MCVCGGGGGGVGSLFSNVVLNSGTWLLYFNCVFAVVWLSVRLCSVFLPRSALSWSVIVVFPGHIHLFSADQ